MLLALGLFAFSIGTAPYLELSRRTEARHAFSDRLGARAASQFLGPGEEAISLAGLILPEVAGTHAALDQLRAMQAEGKSWPLVDARGRVHGNFVITGIDNRDNEFLDNGVPRRSDFNIELKRVD